MSHKTRMTQLEHHALARLEAKRRPWRQMSDEALDQLLTDLIGKELGTDDPEAIAQVMAKLHPGPAKDYGAMTEAELDAEWAAWLGMAPPDAGADGIGHLHQPGCRIYAQFDTCKNSLDLTAPPVGWHSRTIVRENPTSDTMASQGVSLRQSRLDPLWPPTFRSPDARACSAVTSRR